MAQAVSVYSNGGNLVKAEPLFSPTGAPILKADGSQMLAPAGFNLTSFAATVPSELQMKDFGTGGPADIQRTYPDAINPGTVSAFVMDFRPVASFALGWVAASNDVSLNFTIAMGGAVNIKNSLNNKKIEFSPSLSDLGNGPGNAENIRAGYAAKLAANPIPVYQDISGGSEIGVMRVVVGYTGYTGKDTGWTTPAERGPGPGVNPALPSDFLSRIANYWELRRQLT